MKILFVCELGKATAGGGYALLKYAEYLAKRGHTVSVDGVHPDNPFMKDIDRSLFHTFTHRPYFPRVFKGAGRIDDFLQKAYTETSLRKLVVRERFDWIIGSLREAAMRTVKLAQWSGSLSANFVYETPPLMEHDLKELWFEEFRGRFKKSWLKTKKAYLQTDVLISNSALTKRWCEKWLRTKRVTDYVYPGVEPVPLFPDIKSREHIIYIGRLDRYKNIEFAIEAVSKIKNAPRFIIVGHGPEREELEKLAGKLKVKADFLGRVTDSEKWRLLQEAKLLVFPSLHEGFGMPPMEALMMQTPVVCSDKEIFHEVYGSHVEYVPLGDVNAFADKIKYLLDNPSYRKKKGAEGRKFALSEFSWDKVTDKLEAILKTELFKRRPE